MRVLPGPLRRLAGRVEDSPLGSRLARGAFWSLAGAVISRGLMLVAMIVAARILGREAFGELGIIQSTMMMFAAFAGFGLGLTATKHVAEFREADPERAGRIIGLSSLVALCTGGAIAGVVIAIAPWLAARTLAAPHLAGMLRLGTGIFFFGALNGAQTGALAGFEAFKAIAKANLVSGVLAFPLIAGGVYLYGVPGAVGGLVASHACTWTVNHVALRMVARRFRVPLALAGCMKEWRVLWHFSLPAALGASLTVPVGWIGQAMLVNQANGYAEMGVFAAAAQWRVAICFLPSVLTRPCAPMLSDLYSQGDRRAFLRVLLGSLALGMAISVGLAAAVALMSRGIMTGYGEEFAGGYVTLVVLAAAGVAVTAGNVLHPGVVATGRMWFGLSARVAWAVAFLLCAWLLMDRGALGLALATLIAYGSYLLPAGLVVWYGLRECVRTGASSGGSC